MQFFNPAHEIYKVYGDQREDRQRSLSHYPSGLCAINRKGDFIGKCRRAIVYEMLGELQSNPVDGVTLFKFDIGNMLHEKMSNMIDMALVAYYPGSNTYDDKLGYGREIVVKWKERGLLYPFSGKLDKRFFWDNLNMGSEWKSIYGRGVTDIKNNGPKEDALLQVMSYMRQKRYRLDAYILSYIAKDSGYIYSFQFWYKDKQLRMRWLNSGAESVVPWRWADIKRALMLVEEHMELETLPDRDYVQKHWRCNYCSYKDLCWAVHNG